MEEVRIRRTPDFIETSRGSASPRIVILGDLHGDREMFWGILAAAKCIKMLKKKTGNSPRWIGKDTIVVCLGDTVDSQRPEIPPTDQNGWDKNPGEKKLQYDILDLDVMARLTGGRVLSILGNHDIFAMDSYAKQADIESYGSEENRIKAFSPGGEMANMFAETRNVIQIVGPCLFVHGSLLPEFITMFPYLPSDTMHEINTDIKKYLKGEAPLPDWFRVSSKKGINPLECRDFGYGTFNRKKVKNMLTYFPGKVNFIAVGHTYQQKITRYGPVICTDVGISRAFGPKNKDIIAEWVEIKQNKPYRCVLDIKGDVLSILLRKE